MEISMTGRTALITGGSKGLGLAMAKEFARCGARVAMVARGQAALEQAQTEVEALGDQPAGHYVCDVTDPEQIEATFRQVTTDLGPVDILVNNAGHASTGRFEDITDATWQQDLDLKLFAAIRFSRLAFPGMRERRWGRIINMLAVAAKAPPAGSAPTAISRAAGMALTKVLANEGAPDNVLVNALLIGLIKSDQVRRWWEASDQSMTLEAFTEQAGRKLPMGRMGEAQECANLATFLASEAGSYVNGCAINMDGGMSPVV